MPGVTRGYQADTLEVCVLKVRLSMFVFQAHTADLCVFIYERDRAEKHCIGSAQISLKCHQCDFGVLCRVKFKVIGIWGFILFIAGNFRSETGAQVPILTARQVQYFQINSALLFVELRAS